MQSAVFLGTSHASADEDNFYTFKRRNAEVDKAEKMEERLKRQINVKVGAHTGVVKSFGKPRPAVKESGPLIASRILNATARSLESSYRPSHPRHCAACK
ncbi:hypothetical protein B0H21DRAFT_448992 [Amylocystis lapponica]|nr:hypothetical protein B0H21DRAFT_448992 [Amylocystis lapponica]